MESNRDEAHGQETSRDELTAWLAAETNSSAAEVAEGLEAGERRRAFVVDELADAGFTGPELLELVVRLTGLPRRAAKALVAERAQRIASAEPVEVPERDVRLVGNEIRFRSLNEQLAALDETARVAGMLTLVCECSDRSCWKPVEIEVAEYDWLRQDPLRFVVLPGHEAPAIEDVAERHPRFVVIRKHPETHAEAALADPRRPPT
ncbi:MAG: hypothetical protein H0X39_05395 [Actinobacteria bacterium]|nr:hypothetical protein [Actinomycetota bacterium]